MKKLTPVRKLGGGHERFFTDKDNTKAVFEGDIFTTEDVKSGRVKGIAMKNPVIVFRPDGKIEVKENK